jgi:hypothetical protein
MQKSWYAVGAALALVLLATSPLAAQTPVAFDLNTPGSGANLAGVYTSPYTATISGGPTVPVICDDFADESYVPEDWMAYVTSLSSLTPTGTDSVLKWDGAVSAPSLLQTAAYEVAAILSIDILAAPTGSQAQEDYSYALWGLFDPTGTSSDPGAFTQLANYGDTTDESNAKTDLATAIGDVTGNSVNGQSVSAYLSKYDVTIYSYDSTFGVTGCGGCSGPPQEFITVTAVAEPSAPALLGVDLLGLVGLIFIARRYGRLARWS